MVCEGNGVSVPEVIETERSAPVAIPELLGRERARSVWRRRLGWIAAAAVLLSVVAFLALRRGEHGAARPAFKTEPVTVGALTVKVSVTGTLKPTNNVEVGSELSGLVAKVLVDENDHVKKGDALAQIDVSKLQDAVARSRAAVAAAEAQVLQSEATVMEARSTLDRYEQVSQLSGGKVPSRAEMDAGRANLKRAEASAAMARANVPQARATLRSDETNLGKATIRSPIDGVVLTRKVDPGQTVAATLQAPVLFTIAEDLQKMELQVDVDEADVGQVKVGQSVTFTVDAWPGRTYAGVVTRLGYGSQTKDGVVSYPAVIAVDNRDLSLRPGMTATAEIVTVTRRDALLVPNAALRFTPAPSGGAMPMPPKGPGGGGMGLMGRLLPRPPPDKAKLQPPQAPPGAAAGARVWIASDSGPTPVTVRTGATNGQVTEILGGGSLSAGTPVITEMLGSGP
jgi:HlyD family secretion protein